MKKLLLLILVFALAVPAAWAQDDISVQQVEANGKKNTEGNPNMLSAEDLFTEYASVSAISNLRQAAADANNLANIQLRGDNNSAFITQDGSNITGAISVDGYSGNTVNMTQTGSNLLSLITVQGSSNTLSMDQNGNNLGNLVQVDGRGLNIGLEQDNSGFRYFQDGATSNPIQITSSSNYVPIIIRNN